MENSKLEKQIDNMAKDLCHTETCEIKKIGIPCNHRCKAHIYATRAVDKGYVKASEVAEEIFAEIEKNMVAIDDIDFNHFRAIGRRTFAELKKKYTESEKDNG